MLNRARTVWSHVWLPVLAGGCSDVAYVHVTIDDPAGLARDATHVAVGPSLDRMKSRALDGEHLPVTLAATASSSGGDFNIWAEARDHDGAALGRGVAKASLEPGGGEPVTVRLAAVCSRRPPDGVECARVDASQEIGICVNGACVSPLCGDGFHDAVRGEECDDGNDNPNDRCSACRRVVWEPSLVFGLGPGAGMATDTDLAGPLVIASDRAGNLYFYDALALTLRRYDAAAQRLTPLGGRRALSVEPGTASRIGLDFGLVTGIDVDELGNVYISDGSNYQVRRISAGSSEIALFAGTGIGGDAGDGDLAILAKLNLPTALATDGDGSLLVIDSLNNRIRRIDRRSGKINAFAGSGQRGFCGDGQPAVNACLNEPIDLAVDLDGNTYILDRDNYRVRKVDALTGTITTIAGDGSSSRPVVRPTRALQTPLGKGLALDVDGEGNVYIVSTWHVERYDPLTEMLEAIACTGIDKVSDDGGPAIDKDCAHIQGLAVDGAGTVYVAETDSDRIRRLFYDDLPDHWVFKTIAGTGRRAPGIDTTDLASMAATLFRAAPGMVAAAGDADVLLVDPGNNQLLRFQTGPNVVMSREAGTGEYGYAGDNGSARDAKLAYPRGVAYDPNTAAIFLADRDNHCIRRINAAGIITTVAGTGSFGFSGDGPAESSQLNFPSAVAIDSKGRLVIADTLNHRIRRLDFSTAMLTTLLGTGMPTFNDDGPAAEGRALNRPMGLFTVPLAALVAGTPGDLVFFADRGNQRVRMYVDGVLDLGPLGVMRDEVRTIAGNGEVGYGPTSSYAGEAIDALTTPMEYPRAVLPYPDPNCTACVLVGDGIDRVRVVSPTFDLGSGLTFSIRTLLGGAGAAEDGPFADGLLREPSALVAVGNGEWLVADRGSGRIRSLSLTSGQVRTIGGFPEGEAATSFKYTRLFRQPRGLAVDEAMGMLYVSEAAGHVVRRVSMTGDPRDWVVEDYAGQLDQPGSASGSAAVARFNTPAGLEFDPVDRVLYVADEGNHVVRSVDVDDGVVAVVAGKPGQVGSDSPYPTPGEEAFFFGPTALALGPGGLYVAERDANRVRLIADPAVAPVVHTVIGYGNPASSGEGAPAWQYPVDAPEGLAIDRFGNLLVASRTAIRLIVAGFDGLATGEDEVTTIYGGVWTPRFPEQVTRCLTDIEVRDDATVYFLDSCLGVLVSLTRMPGP